jgi:hypothetical protein
MRAASIIDQAGIQNFRSIIMQGYTAAGIIIFFTMCICSDIRKTYVVAETNKCV